MKHNPIPEDEMSEPSPTPNAQSEALIEAFLAKAGMPGAEVEAEAEEPEIPIEPGHKSGFVALIGRPNVGKSTLVNTLVEQKIAIVSRKPQTTRTRITGILTQPAYQMILIDTPGIHREPGHKLNKKMIEEAVAAIPDADVLLFVVDVSVSPREEDRLIARLIKEKRTERPVFFVLNKMDQLPMERAQENIEGYWALLPEYAGSMPVSALQGTNVELLRDQILTLLPEGPRYYPSDQITDQTERQIAAELIREAALRYTHEEIPHATAILVEEYSERPNGTLYISARIWVERESQKPILIGKQGQMLKKIGEAARKELERLIGGKVYLDLWVKVQPKWRDEDNRLRELGFK